MNGLPATVAECRQWVEAMHAALMLNDEQAFAAALQGFNALQDSSVMTHVRKVAGDLQSALEQFRSDSRLVDLAERTMILRMPLRPVGNNAACQSNRRRPVNGLS